MILNKIKKATSVFKQFWKLLSQKFRVQFCLMFFAILVGSLLETLGVSVLLPLIQAILTPEKLMANKYVVPLVKFFNIQSSSAFVLAVSVFVVIFYIIKNLYQILNNYWQNKFRTNLLAYITETMMSSYMHRPYSFFIDNNSSILMRNVINDTGGVTTCVTSLFQIITTFFVIIFMFAFLFVTDAFLATGLCVSAVLVLGCSVIILGKPLRNFGEKLRITDGACYKNCQQAFQGIKEIIVSKKEDYFANEYKKSYDEKNSADVKKCVLEYIPNRMIEAVCLSVLVLLISYNVVSGRVLSEVMIANLGAFAVAAFKLLPSVSALSSNFNTYIVQYTAVQAVLTNLEEARHYIVKYGREPVTFEKSLQTKNLCFSYPKNPDKKILDNVDTEIKNGDVVGIKGSSGSGKTTYVDIILGLLEPVSGEILIDGKKLTDANVNAWREKISYVPQTAYLIDDTIRANIAFGVPEKEIDDERITIAMKEAMLYDYVSGLPEKEKTVVGERGVQMSGGQRQRLSIARALYNNPDIIIFDEATSALDEITEKEIMESIDNLIGQKTLMIIAHRLSTLKKCNKIFEVADGKINISEK